jgi:hypothetical protein
LVHFGLTLNSQKKHKKNNRLTKDNIQRLESLPKWSWDPLADRWEKGFSYLLQYIEQEGHTRIPANFETDDGFKLRYWVTHQKLNKKLNRLTKDNIQRLESLPKWSWSYKESMWNDGFARLCQFNAQSGHVKVQQDFSDEDGFRLGGWVASQRQSKMKLTPDQIKKLESLKGWVWEAKK